MNDEISGRLEALSRFVLQLTAALETNGQLDGPEFCRQLRDSSSIWPDHPEYMRIARQRVGELAVSLDLARTHRETPRPR